MLLSYNVVLLSYNNDTSGMSKLISTSSAFRMSSESTGRVEFSSTSGDHQTNMLLAVDA